MIEPLWPVDVDRRCTPGFFFKERPRFAELPHVRGRVSTGIVSYKEQLACVHVSWGWERNVIA